MGVICLSPHLFTLFTEPGGRPRGRLMGPVALARLYRYVHVELSKLREHTMALVLSLDECIRVNASLLKAVRGSDIGALKDILDALKASDVRNKLKVCMPPAHSS